MSVITGETVESQAPVVQFEETTVADFRTDGERFADGLLYGIEQALQLGPDHAMTGTYTADLVRVNDQTGRGITSKIVVSAEIAGSDLPTDGETAWRAFDLDHTQYPPSISEDHRRVLASIALRKDDERKQRYVANAMTWGDVVSDDGSWAPHRAILHESGHRQSYWLPESL